MKLSDSAETVVLLHILKSIMKSKEAGDWLETVTENDLRVDALRLKCHFLIPGIGEPPVRDLAEKMHVQARGLAATIKKLPNQSANLPYFEMCWALARLLEWVGQAEHPPFCKFCFRTVMKGPEGRYMGFCAQHAQGGKEKINQAGYLRGWKAFPEFSKRLSQLTFDEDEGGKVDVTWEIVEHLLKMQYNFANAGGGDAAYMMKKFLEMPTIEESAKVDGPSRKEATPWLFAKEGARVITIDDHISEKYPSVSELAERWRKREGDAAGVEFLENHDHTLSWYKLIGQWIRYAAWFEAGDRESRIGSGRPSRLDGDQVRRMLAENIPVAEIARRFGVKPGSVYAHLKKHPQKEKRPPPTQG
jgi:hypothetical protein